MPGAHGSVAPPAREAGVSTDVTGGRSPELGVSAISLRYAPTGDETASHLALSDISFRVRPGEFIAIIGLIHMGAELVLARPPIVALSRRFRRR